LVRCVTGSWLFVVSQVTVPEAAGEMASLAESQAFLDQFDKCLPLCERGDAVTVINALHTLNTITQASITQALELDPATGKDFVCSFLIELELALELFISPARMLGTIDGGLPALYSFEQDEISGLVDAPSPSTKDKVRRFLNALGVEASSEFENRSVAQTVKEFLKYQIEPSSGKCPPALPAASKVREHRSISWADQCSIGSDYDSDVPPLDDEDASDVDSAEEVLSNTELEGGASLENSSDEEEEEEEVAHRSAAAIFLWAAPVKLDVPEYREEGPTRHSRRASDESAGSEQSRESARKAATRPVEPFFKTRRCKNWDQNGSCPFGDRCNFAHGDADLRPADAAVLALTSKPAVRKQPEGEAERWDRRPNQGKSTGNYKTRMCKNWEQSGSCVFGDKCLFAHGAEELRKKRNAARTAAVAELQMV